MVDKVRHPHFEILFRFRLGRIEKPYLGDLKFSQFSQRHHTSAINSLIECPLRQVYTVL